MVEIVWEFVVKGDSQGQFELAYGPGGAWSKLFAKSPGFRGTTVMRDEKNPNRYLTIDLWDSEAQRTQALADNMTEFSDLEISFDKWTDSKTELGTFRLLAQASVRPWGKAGRSKAR